MSSADIEQALASEDAELRRQAVMAIEQADDPALSSLLLRALGDEDWRVREEAVAVGARLGDRFPLVSGLVDAVAQGGNVGLRNAALELLGELGSSAVEALVAALPRVDESARKFVIEALARSGDTSVVTTLIEATHGDDSNLIAAAIEALAVLGGADAEQALRRLLRSSDSFQRIAAVDALNRLGASIPWEELEPLLSDRLVFRVALVALGRSGREEALAPALAALADRSERVVATAALALHELGDKPALGAELGARLRDLGETARERLRSLARRGDDRVRLAATQLLALARDPGAYDVVVELASRDSLTPGAVDAVRVWGMEAVRGIFAVYLDGRTRFGPTALELAGDLALEVSNRTGDPIDPSFRARFLEALRHELQSGDPAMLVSAARSLGVWGESEDARRLLAHASSDDEAVRRACHVSLRALADRDPQAVASALVGVNLEGTGGPELTQLVAVLGGPAARTRLNTALLADDPGTRCAALRGLAEQDGAKAVELIALSLTDESPAVQVEAARALGTLRNDEGEPVGVEPLLLALSRGEPHVQSAVVDALAATGDRRAVQRLREKLSAAPALLRIAIIKALRALRADNLGELLVEGLGAEDPEVVKQSLVAIADEGGARAYERVAIALDHRAWDVRRTAAELLARAPASSMHARLRSRLDREDDTLVRMAIEHALTQGEEEER